MALQLLSVAIPQLVTAFGVHCFLRLEVRAVERLQLRQQVLYLASIGGPSTVVSVLTPLRSEWGCPLAEALQGAYCSAAWQLQRRVRLCCAASPETPSAAAFAGQRGRQSSCEPKPDATD
jgi:hypothetical protein